MMAKIKELNPSSSTETRSVERTTGWFSMSDLGSNALIRRINIRYLSGDDITVKLFVDGDSDTSINTTIFRANSGLTGATLSAGISDSVITLPTSSTTKLKDGDWVKIGSEIMKVITAGTTSHTVQRGMRGTSVAAHNSGATISYNNYPSDSIRISKRAKYAQVKIEGPSSVNSMEINKMEIEYA
tara:strand:- start:1432 stop:1986 length:555 start_codon:yes stop_codon:yes gene_type:complete